MGKIINWIFFYLLLPILDQIFNFELVQLGIIIPVKKIIIKIWHYRVPTGDLVLVLVLVGIEKSNWNFIFLFFIIIIIFFTGIIMPNWTNWKFKIWSKIGNISQRLQGTYTCTHIWLISTYQKAFRSPNVSRHGRQPDKY